MPTQETPESSLDLLPCDEIARSQPSMNQEDVCAGEVTSVVFDSLQPYGL